MGHVRKKQPTILDIAKRAGVSKSAVSRALTGQGEVSDATRKKVEDAARELGYVANAMARGLRSRTKTLGVVLRDVTRPFYGELQAGMQAQAERRGYQMVTATSTGDLGVAEALKALKSLVSLQVDGLAIASARLPSEDIVPFIDRVPIVVAGRRETGRGITSVFCDDAEGGRQLAQHVLALGHEQIAVVVVSEEYSLSQHARGAAMVETIKQAGKTPVLWKVRSDTDTAAAVTAHLGGSGVSAIMCPTDPAMVDVLEILRNAGIGVPERVTVTGYDGFGPFAAPYLGLSTFRQPVREIGKTAIDLLIDKIEGVSTGDRLVTIRGELVPGRTAGSRG